MALHKLFSSGNQRQPASGNPTIVTALLDIGRGAINPDFKRSFDQYLEHFVSLLAVDLPFCIYIQPQHEPVVWQHRKKANTRVILMEPGDLKSSFPFYPETQIIRQNPQWLNQAAWLTKSPQATLPLYNPLVMSKLFFLETQARENPFSTEQFYWLDAGIAGTVHPGYFTHDKVLHKLPGFVKHFAFVCYPYTGNTEIHGFERTAMAKIAGTHYIDRVARGGFFGGTRDDINSVSTHYRTLLKDTLQEGYMGTEESIFSLLTYLHKPLDVFYIEANGLLSTFFEDLKNDRPNTTPPKYERERGPLVITDSDIQYWHDTCHIHFHNTLNVLNNYFEGKPSLSLVDIGASTGRFAEMLSQTLDISKALLVEPFKQAADFATALFAEKPGYVITSTALSDKTGDAWLRICKSEDGNLGALTLSEYPEENTQKTAIEIFDTFFESYNWDAIDIVKIHTGDHSTQVLKGMTETLSRLKTLPVIVLDYGYYDSKEQLREAIKPLFSIGYRYYNAYTFSGGDIVLLPGPFNPESEKSAENHSLPFTASTYIITYNLPSQLELLLQSFEQSGNYLLENTNKFLLNNSDDNSTDEAYTALCRRYGLTELKQGNLGICGGRQFIAEHFAENNARHMFFFEDDMLLHGPHAGVCRNGLATTLPDLFNTAIEILEHEQFDFLKLSFTEFFGDNKTQWAWYNIPQHVREVYFPDHHQLPENGHSAAAPQTHFTGIKTLHGISYLTGDIYYSNWPQVLSQQGNKKMFLDTRWAHPYEQTWMSHFFQLTKRGELNPGLLLASPINHSRVYHYDGKLRKENNPEISYR